MMESSKMRIGNRDVMIWGPKSDGTDMISKELGGVQRILKRGSKYQWKPPATPDSAKLTTLCIGWGRSWWPEQYIAADKKTRDLIEDSFLNKPPAVGRSVNKHTSFKMFANAGVRIPWVLLGREHADEVRKRNGDTVVCRNTLTGCDGEGIIMCEPGEPLPAAELYVQYIEKDAEYRVHVFRGTIIDRVKKVFPDGHKCKDRRIRTTGNGILFQRNGIYVPKDVYKQAVKAVAALGLDFAGVDVVTVGERAYVLETNTAPEMLPVVTKKFCDEVRKICAE
jgi:hypothetical protein